MNTRELQEEILKLKKEKNICILAHSYQSRPIVEVADYVGDSFQLSQMATKVDAKTVIMCGVRFMAETVKILSPEFTIEVNSFTNMAAPVPAMTIYVVNNEMKAYLDSKLTAYDKSYITVVVM